MKKKTDKTLRFQDAADWLDLPRCQSCIMPLEDPHDACNIREECNRCASHRKTEPERHPDELTEILRASQAQGKYACVIPVSGGKDSSFILSKICREEGIRPLVVHLRSGFANPVAYKNVLDTCRHLGVKLVVRKSRLLTLLAQQVLWTDCRRRRKIRYSTVCDVCEAHIRWCAIAAARKHRVPIVVWGSSAEESQTEERYAAYRKRIPFETGAESYGVNRSQSQRNVRNDPVSSFLSMAAKLAFGIPLHLCKQPSRAIPFDYRDVRTIHFYDYYKWDGPTQEQYLQKEGYWTSVDGKTDRFDCLLHVLANYYYLEKHGITFDGINYCNAIRQGVLSRNKALQRELLEIQLIPEQMGALSRSLHLPLLVDMVK